MSSITLQNFTNFAAVNSGRSACGIRGESIGAATIKQYIGLASKSNRAVMAAFRECLRNEYGVFGEHAFDSVLGLRADQGGTLRASDISSVMRVLTPSDKGAVRRAMISARFENEVMRQAETNPRVLNANVMKGMRQKLSDAFKNDALFQRQVMSARSQDELTRIVAKRLNVLMDLHEASSKAGGVDDGKYGRDLLMLDDAPLNDDGGKMIKQSPTMGLAGLDGQLMKGSETSVEDRVRTGKFGAGMRVNAQGVGLVFEKLKTNGVEPGFIAKRDWSAADTLAMMKDDGGELDLAARQALEGILKRPLGPNDDVKALKERHFAEIRDTIRAGLGNVKHLTNRFIVKLDYNEGDRKIKHSAGSVGSFRLPARNVAKGFFYRNFRVTGADDASVGAVAEALANDLTRAMGISTQDLTLAKGEYSDGHEKIILVSKFADGYHDFDGNYIKDGRLVPKTRPDGTVEVPEELGKYKAMFLLLADRDAVGSHGQNKGLINGNFFAIDPGHSLEGSGKDLEIHDDFSFVDKGGSAVTKGKRFLNYSVFDDSNRSEKLKGMMLLRAAHDAGKFKEIFDAYKSRFLVRDENGRTNKLNGMIQSRISEMEAEFNGQYDRLMKIFGPQLAVHDKVEAYFEGKPQKDMGDKVIDAIENLERLHSPTTTHSQNGSVKLKHLEVKPQTRVPWTAHIEPRRADKGEFCDTVVFSCDKNIPKPLKGLGGMLEDSLCHNSDNPAHTEIRIPIANMPTFLKLFNEDAVKKVLGYD